MDLIGVTGADADAVGAVGKGVGGGVGGAGVGGGVGPVTFSEGGGLLSYDSPSDDNRIKTEYL